jgi:hypothetical protein
MTDRELLELAAKAAGIEVFTGEHDDGLHDVDGFAWNPLTNDGDALRLAVRTGMDIHCGGEFAKFVGVGEPPRQTMEPRRPDEYAATRRAIVRAAAAMVS